MEVSDLTADPLANRIAALRSLLAFAFLLYVLSALALLAHGVPDMLCPYPFPLAVLTFKGLPELYAAAVPTAAFCLWCLPSFRGNLIPARRALVSYVCVALLSSLWFAFRWRQGLEHHGREYTMTAALTSLGFACAVGLMLFLSRKSASVRLNVFNHWLLFAWACIYAFPYLGQMP